MIVSPVVVTQSCLPFWARVKCLWFFFSLQRQLILACTECRNWISGDRFEEYGEAKEDTGENEYNLCLKAKRYPNDPFLTLMINLFTKSPLQRDSLQ